MNSSFSYLNGINRAYYQNKIDGSEFILYEGQYLDNKKDGYGRIIFEDGDFYQG